MTLNLSGRFEKFDISRVGGNAPDDLKQHLVFLRRVFGRGGTGFADKIGERVKITRVDLDQVGTKKRLQSKVVCETTVERGA